MKARLVVHPNPLCSERVERTIHGISHRYVLAAIARRDPTGPSGVTERIEGKGQGAVKPRVHLGQTNVTVMTTVPSWLGEDI